MIESYPLYCISDDLAMFYFDNHSSGLNLYDKVDFEQFVLWADRLENKRFYFRGGGLSFTARKERVRRGDYWYAYRRVRGRLCKRYLGMSYFLRPSALWRVAFGMAQVSLFSVVWLVISVYGMLSFYR